ncbi:CCA-adding enzyme [Listeria ilorinensis]|uniref:CCA-adding enzyme n=1 Tax=Listeria ilorinensis TaxID=2867439 RepID=UPI001EF627D5|nr:CCA-adding enzyme [Listeria ilorinensis]
MTDIRQLKDPDGTLFYPQTHIMGVIGLSAQIQKLDTIEIGAEVNNVTEEEKAIWNAKQDAFLVSPSGYKFKLIISDAGILSAERV